MMLLNSKPSHQKAAEIVRDAGGRIVGRTRLQKLAFLLELAGFGEGFRFEYRHYGPYSEQLTNAINTASAFGLVNEEERRATWGGMYSIYNATERAGSRVRGLRSSFAEKVANLGAIELELASTAAYLSVMEDYTDPWSETARRKPEKAINGRIERAKEAYCSLLCIETPRPLPRII